MFGRRLVFSVVLGRSALRLPSQPRLAFNRPRGLSEKWSAPIRSTRPTLPAPPPKYRSARSTPTLLNTNTDIERTPFRYHAARRESQRHDRLTPAAKLSFYRLQPGFLPLTKLERATCSGIVAKGWKPALPASSAPTGATSRSLGATRSPAVGVDEDVAAGGRITGPQFRIEEKRWRKTDPLAPVYVYDGNTVEGVRTRRPHYGSQFARTEQEAYALRTDDILTEKVFNREYPKALIKTRTVNRTDDITGAQADTRSSAPKLWKIKDPMLSATKLTNRVIDIDGAVAGTGGQGPLLYRARKQASAIAAANAARTADIAAVRALK